MQTDLITSRDNPLFRRLKKLAESSRVRRETRTALLDGEHLIEAYLDAGGQPLLLLRSASCPARVWQPLAMRAGSAKVAVFSDSLFADLSPVASPAGILAEVAWLNPAPIEAVPLVLLLEDIQDPGNLGSLLRCAAAAGATLAVLSKGCHDAWSPKALRGGQGAQFVLPMLLRANLSDWIRSSGLPVWALTPSGGVSVFDLDLRVPAGIVVGNEGAGLSEEILRLASARVHIPMPGRVDSLNVATAAAVALFEAVRQRRGRGLVPSPDPRAR